MRWCVLAALVCSVIGLELWQILLTPPLLFGHKTQALFDFWSIEHAMGGIIVGHGIARYNRYMETRDWLWLMLLAAYSWEFGECGMEGYGTAHMRTWLAGTEHWSNRLLSDPILFTIGGLLGRWDGRTPWASLALYLGWYGLNLAQPTCMTLQLEVLSHLTAGLP